jgi:hypothetical protein
MIPNHLLSSLLYFVTPTNTVPQQEIHTRGYSNPGLVDSPQPWHGGLQSPNRIVTPAGTTLPCKAWSFTEGNTPEHHVHKYNQVFPRQLMKYEETHQCRYITRAKNSESDLLSWIDNPQSNN